MCRLQLFWIDYLCHDGKALFRTFTDRCMGLSWRIQQNWYWSTISYRSAAVDSKTCINRRANGVPFRRQYNPSCSNMWSVYHYESGLRGKNRVARQFEGVIPSGFYDDPKLSPDCRNHALCWGFHKCKTPLSKDGLALQAFFRATLLVRPLWLRNESSEICAGYGRLIKACIKGPWRGYCADQSYERLKCAQILEGWSSFVLSSDTRSIPVSHHTRREFRGAGELNQGNHLESRFARSWSLHH